MTSREDWLPDDWHATTSLRWSKQNQLQQKWERKVIEFHKIAGIERRCEGFEEAWRDVPTERDELCPTCGATNSGEHRLVKRGMTVRICTDDWHFERNQHAVDNREGSSGAREHGRSGDDSPGRTHDRRDTRSLEVQSSTGPTSAKSK